MLVVGIKAATASTELDQLLKAIGVGIGRAALVGAAHRSGETVELDHIAGNIDRVGRDTVDSLAQQLRQLIDPLVDHRLAGRHHDLAASDTERQDVESAGIAARHHIGDSRQIDLQRVDVRKLEPESTCHPGAQGFEVEHLMRWLEAGKLALGNRDQSMPARLRQPRIVTGNASLLGIDQTVFDQCSQHLLDSELSAANTKGTRLASERRRGGCTGHGSGHAGGRHGTRDGKIDQAGAH